MLPRKAMHQYQVAACEFMQAKPRCAVWLDLGLGKTVITLSAVSDLIDQFQVSRVLIIAPLRVAGKTWPDEVQKWEHLRHLRLKAAVGNARKRLAALQAADCNVLAVNVENLAWLERTVGGRSPFDMVVVDEASLFKDRSTIRFRSLVRLARQATRTVMLTGTPAPNSYADLWAQFYVLDSGQRLFTSKKRFMDAFFKQTDRDGRKFVLKRGAAAVVHNRVQDITVAMKSEDYLELPERIDDTIAVDLPPPAREAYRDMEAHCMAEMGGQEIKAVTAAAVAGKLMQMANGRVYGPAREVRLLHDAKLDALREILASASEPVVVWYVFQSDRDAIMQAIPQAKAITETGVIDRWNRGEVPVLVAHPASAGHGLNLQQGGRVMVWYGLGWSLELYRQACARLHRQGQTKPVLVYHLVAADTIDETVLSVLRQKDAGQEALLAALKARLGGWHGE